MKAFLLLALALLLPVSAPAAELSRLSYGELAARVIRTSWAETNASIGEANENSLPHEVKDSRKQIASLKEQLDLFAFAYPSEPTDLWMEIRDDLDKGYEVFGEFKDFFDVQGVSSGDEARYDESELKPVRKELLKWTKKWAGKAASYSAFLHEPDTRKLHSRSKKKLSRFYWGAVSIEPDPSLTGTQNLAALCLGLRDAAISDWGTVRKLENPSVASKDEETFHDFRKRIRSLGRILRTFPAIYSGQEANLVELEALASEYGDLHDKIVAHEKAVAAGKDKKAAKLQEEIGDSWRELVKKQEKRGIKSLLKSILIS